MGYGQELSGCTAVQRGRDAPAMGIKSAKGKIKQLLGSAKEALLLDSQIEIVSNTHAVIQGAKGIMEYNDDSIRVKLNDREVQFYGENLSIECLSQDSMELKGKISRIEYI